MKAEKELKRAERTLLDYLMLFSMLIFDVGFFAFRLYQGAEFVVLAILPLLAVLQLFLIFMLLPGKLEFDFRAAMRPYYLVFLLPALAYIAFGLMYHTETVGVFYVAAALRLALYSMFLVLSTFERLAKNIVAVALCTLIVVSVALSANAVSALFEPETGFSWKWPLKRTLQYTYEEQSDTYVVTGIYSGISTIVEIPETYAGKRVSGIAANAFKGDEFVAEIVVNGHSQSQVLASEKKQTQNMSFLSSTSNTFFIGDGAFADCKNLQRVVVNVAPTLGKNIFAGSPNLQKVEFTAPDVGTIDPEAFSGIAAATQIETNPQSTDSFRVAASNSGAIEQIAPKVDEDTVFVNFVDADFYVKTVTMPRGTRLTSQMLETIDGKNLFLDTVAGEIKDYTHQALKPNTTLVGWYTTKDFSGEKVKFSDTENGGNDGTVVNQSLTLFSRRLQIFSAEMKDGYSGAVVQTMLFTVDDTETLPTLTRQGYTFQGWQDSTTKQTLSEIALETKQNLVLEAKWQLLAPTVNMSTDKTNNTMEYAIDKTMTLSVDVDHVIKDQLDFSFAWYFEDTLLEGKTSSTLVVANVLESGNYSCVVVATNKTYKTENSSKDASVNVEISPQTIAISWDKTEGAEFTYNKTAVLPKASFVGQNEIEIQLSDVVYKLGDTTVSQPTNVGNYKASVSLLDSSGNYQLDASQKELSFSIVAAKLEISLQDQKGDYQKTKPTVSMILDTDYSISSGAVVGDDDLGLVLDLEPNGANWGAGDYDIVATWTNQNYDVEVTQKAVFKIKPAEIEVKALQQEFTYQKTKPTLAQNKYEVTSGTVFDGDDLGVTIGFLNPPVGGIYSATTYDISLAVSNSNYTVVDLKDEKIKINPAPVTLTADDVTVYYNGAAQSLSLVNAGGYTVTEGNFFAGDEQSVEITIKTSSEKRNVGTVDLTLSVTKENPNYTITPLNGIFEVLLLPVTITVGSQAKIYNGSEQSFDELNFTVFNHVSKDATLPDNLNIKVVNNSGEAIQNYREGGYALTASYTSNSDYDVTVIGGTFTVEKLSLTITAENQTLEYSKATKTIDPNKFSLETNTDVDSLRDLIKTELSINVFTDDPNGTFVVGDYPIEASYVQSDNYIVSTVAGTYFVEKANVQITLDDQLNLVYVAEVDQNAYTIDGPNDIGWTKEDLGVTLALGSDTKIGDNTIVISHYNKTNFIVTGDPADAKISPREIHVKIFDATFVENSIQSDPEIVHELTSGVFETDDYIVLQFYAVGLGGDYYSRFTEIVLGQSTYYISIGIDASKLAAGSYTVTAKAVYFVGRVEAECYKLIVTTGTLTVTSNQSADETRALPNITEAILPNKEEVGIFE